jgi:hypothetical protein
MMRHLAIRAALGRLLIFVLSVAAGTAAFAGFPDVSELSSQPDLPDPLKMMNGESVTTKDDWVARRRPELKALFRHYMYGEMPPAPAKVAATVERVDRNYVGGKATKKEVTLAFGPPDTPKIHLLLVVPNGRKGPAPAFVGLNFNGNHTVVNDPTVPLPTGWVMRTKDNRASEADRGSQVDVWAIDEVIGRGYALATFYCGDVAPDHPGRADGVFPHYRKPGVSGHTPTEWGAVAAWAWGLQRAVDYLVTDKDIDTSRIAVVGHSRLGKAAIVAAAFDERIALAIPHQAGCGGTAPSRGKVGESVKQINDRFPHWFDDEFKRFNDHVDRLPFDQHCLVALVAPRPVLFTNAVEDTWANPEGQFQVLQAAVPVYRLLGAGGLDADRMPPIGKLIDSTLGYHIRPGKHSMGREDWKVFLEYADKHLRRPGSSK